MSNHQSIIGEGFARTLSAFRIPGYTYLWLNMMSGSLGFMTYNMGQGWLILELTGRPALVGLAPGISGIVMLLLGPLGGVVTDRRDRRSLLLLGGVPGVVQLGYVFGLAAVMGAVRAVQMPSRGGLTFDLVGPALIVNVMALQFLAINLSGIFGPLTGGFILAAWGSGPFFLFVGGITTVGAALLLFMPTPQRLSTTSGSFLANLTEGFSYALRDRQVRTVLWVVMFTETFGFGVLFMLPVVVSDVLHADARALGYLQAAFGAGGIIGTLAIAAFVEVRSRGWVFMGAAFGFGSFIVAFAFSTNLLVSLVLFGAAGVAGTVYDIMGASLVQTMVPSAMRGRVLGLHATLLSGVNLGSMAMGGLAELRGVSFAVGLLASIATGNALRLIPVARGISTRSLSDQSPVEAEPHGTED
jgi:MFS family permease